MIMRRMLILGLALLSAGLVSAQNYVAFPIDALHGYQGQMIPLGASGSSVNFDETRTQHLIPAPYVATAGGMIVALEVSPHVTGSVPYKQLDIVMGHTTLSTLTTTFATNTPMSSVVFSRPNTTMNFPSKTTWYPIIFDTPFRYDGMSNLVIEIQKQINRPAVTATVSHQTTNYPSRADLPQALFAYGQGGSGQYQATTGSLFSVSSRIMWRLRFRDNPTLTIASTRSSTGRDYFHLGSTLTLTMQSNPGDFFIHTFDVGLRSIPLSIPGVQGDYWLPSVFNIFWMGSVPAGGRHDFKLTVPNVPGLVGVHVYFQSVAGFVVFELTNVADCIIAQ